MSKLIVIEYVSLDGVIQGPGHAGEDTDGGFAAGGWTQPLMPDHRRYNTESFQIAGAFLLGRKTYEIWEEYWPTVKDENDLIAHALNTQPKYVASTTLTRVNWKGTTIIRDVATEVPKLKSRPGKPIFVMGSSGLARTLMEHRLVDEYQLVVVPLVLGAGKSLFKDVKQTELKLRDAQHFTNGIVILTDAS